MICCQTLSISVASGPPPFDCGATPAAIQDCVWTQGPFVPPCAGTTSTFAGGSGTFNFSATLAPCIGGVDARAQLCNPGSSYLITVTIPWDDSGSIGLGSTDIDFNFIINGATMDTVTRSLLTGPFTPVVLTAMLPAEMTSEIQIFIVTTAVPSPSYSVFSNGATTLTPLTPP